MYDYVVWCAAFVCTLSCLNLYWTRDNKLSYLILSYLILSYLLPKQKGKSDKMLFCEYQENLPLSPTSIPLNNKSCRRTACSTASDLCQT